METYISEVVRFSSFPAPAIQFWKKSLSACTYGRLCTTWCKTVLDLSSTYAQSNFLYSLFWES